MCDHYTTRSSRACVNMSEIAFATAWTSFHPNPEPGGRKKALPLLPCFPCTPTEGAGIGRWLDHATILDSIDEHATGGRPGMVWQSPDVDTPRLDPSTSVCIRATHAPRMRTVRSVPPRDWRDRWPTGSPHEARRPFPHNNHGQYHAFKESPTKSSPIPILLA